MLEYPTGIKADDSNAVVKDPGISWTREIHPSELYLPKTEAWFLPLGLVDAEKRHWWSTLHPYLSQARDNCGFLALGLRLRDTEQNFQNKLGVRRRLNLQSQGCYLPSYPRRSSEIALGGPFLIKLSPH